MKITMTTQTLQNFEVKILPSSKPGFYPAFARIIRGIVAGMIIQHYSAEHALDELAQKLWSLEEFLSGMEIEEGEDSIKTCHNEGRFFLGGIRFWVEPVRVKA